MEKLTAPQWQLAVRDEVEMMGVEEICCWLFRLISSIMASVASAESLPRRRRMGLVPWPFLSQMLPPPSLVSSMKIWTRSRERPPMLLSIPVASSHSSGSTSAT